jgi:AcrR family transcriptional regulator
MESETSRSSVSTRSRIIREATLLFARKGIAGTRIADIEAAVGLAVGTGSFHRHFRNKDELLAAVVQDATTGLGLPTLDGDLSKDQLAGRIEATLRVLQDQAMLLALVSRLQTERPELAKALHAGFVGWVTPGEGASDARTTIITTAVVGYVVTSQTFGGHPGGLDPATFSAELAAMAQSRPSPSRGRS